MGIGKIFLHDLQNKFAKVFGARKDNVVQEIHIESNVPASVSRSVNRSFGLRSVVGNGKYIKKTLSKVTDFDDITLVGSIDIDYTQCDRVEASILGEENIVEHVNVTQHGRCLVVSLASGSYQYNDRLVVALSSPNIKQVRVDGSGDVVLNHVQQEELSLMAQGSGDIHCNGKADKLTVSVGGSGDVKARKCKSIDVTAKVHGSGDIKVWASSSIKARVSYSGDIKIYGSPSHRDTKVRGSGDIEFD